MASDSESSKQEPAFTLALSSIPQKRAIDEVHSPARPSPLNPDVKFADPPSQTDDDGQASRLKPGRVKKETLKKREAKGDSIPPTPDPKAAVKEVEQSESSPLRYKLAPPKLSDFDPHRGPVLAQHHEAIMRDGDAVEFFETSDQ
jgi:COMPASS component BRE2